MAKAQKGKGLGRGIDSLFNNPLDSFEPISEPDFSKEAVEQLPLEAIRPNPYQPRKDFDQAGLEELAASIKKQGVFQPIIVRKSAIKGYELVAGERRLRASKLAGLEEIPAIVRDYSEETMIQVAVVENLQREDLRPLDEALAYQMLMDSLKLTQEEVATRVGKSRPYVANYLRLLTLPPVIGDMIQAGQLSPGHGRTLLGLKDQKQMLELAKKVIEQGMTVRALEELVQELTQPLGKKKKDKKAKVAKSAFLVESEERLMDKFGTSVQILAKGERGKIEIEYLSQADLARILEVLEIELDD